MVINLTQGFTTTVDELDYEFVLHWKWYAKKGKGTWYAYRNSRPDADGKRKSLLLHRELFFHLNPDADPKLDVDHKDGNGLNNQRSNLRIATDSRQRHNQSLRNNNTSGYLGVGWNKCLQKYSARVRLNWKRRHVGWFDCPIAAAMARDDAVREMHGDFGTYNFPLPGERPAR